MCIIHLAWPQLRLSTGRGKWVIVVIVFPSLLLFSKECGYKAMLPKPLLRVLL